MASAAGSLIGFGTLVIAHNLSLSGDTMEMMRAVLDSNFWLSTHVVTVTTGYASTFLAGFLAIIYIVRGVFTRTLDRRDRRFPGAHGLRHRLLRDAVQLCRHRAGRHLGRPVLGPVLGLGSRRRTAR